VLLVLPGELRSELFKDLQDGRCDNRQEALMLCQGSLQSLQCDVPLSLQPALFSQMLPCRTPEIG
jgi:hypothetical protein